MIRVIGAVAEIVPLPDLNDRVFYKQEKTFSEAEFKGSLDLQKEIQRGRLFILSRTQEKFSDFEVPPEADLPANTIVKNDSSLEVSKIIDMVKSLETRLDGISPGNSENIESVLLNKLVDKIESLENKLSQITSKDNSDLIEAIKRLESKVNESDSKIISRKLDELAIRGVASNQNKPEINKTVSEDVYVPNIRVEDGSSHIKLKTRTIEKSSSVDDAANALKKLRENK